MKKDINFKVVFRNEIIDFKDSEQQSDTQSGQQSGQQNNKYIVLSDKILEFCKTPKTAKEIKDYLNLKSRQYISSNLIKPLITQGKLEYTNKKSINARNQKYVTVNKNIK